MMADLTSTASSDFVATLSKAAVALRNRTGDRPSAKAVVNALLQAEKAAKQQRLTYPLESLLGHWQLCFTAPRQAHLKGGIALGKGFYVPQIAPAQISFGTPVSTSAQSSGQLEIGNQIQFGSLLFKLTGPAQYLGNKNLLAFEFNHMQLMLFGRTVYSGNFRGGKATATDFYHQPIAKLPFFAFFLVTEEFIAARGRGGGLALWVKET
ncbi:hypothetical protein [Chroococcidiopsis sp. CCMEE 29]|uniref:hypothetical protein n=1 Tax=Chroococcidiopsis sp. CCMEE 29 TaxID=155894 RepID=UPI002021ECF1|nr:hypothetical protein [Chroococcidiopsis sp. CCMEE 29]